MKYKVLFLKNLADTGKNYLKEHDCEVVISKAKTKKELLDEVKDMDAFFVRNEPITGEIMDAAPKLKVIAKHGIGYDNIDIAAATERGIQVVYAPRGNVNSVAEQTIMNILCCARRYGIVHNELVRGNYNIRFELNDGYEVSGKTIGLIGCGHIARSVAKKAINGFDMKVIAFDPFLKPGLTEEGIEVIANRKKVFEQADFISIHMPSTPETKHSVGMQEFEWMKPTAFLINTSRGNIVNEADLIQALKKKEILGAGLDVYENEPIEKENELLHMDNVICTPHTAGLTIEASDRLSLTGAQGIVEVFEGKKLTWPVNRIS